MSRAWSIGKTDRCKATRTLFDCSTHLITILSFIPSKCNQFSPSNKLLSLQHSFLFCYFEFNKQANRWTNEYGWLNWIDKVLKHNEIGLIVVYLTVKITAEIKKNRFMANVGPDSYDLALKNKKAEPRWT